MKWLTDVGFNSGEHLVDVEWRSQARGLWGVGAVECDDDEEGERGKCEIARWHELM